MFHALEPYFNILFIFSVTITPTDMPFQWLLKMFEFIPYYKKSTENVAFKIINASQFNSVSTMLGNYIILIFH
jgi:hypothetical protein